MSKTYKVRFVDKSAQLIEKKVEKYFQLLDTKCISIFLPDNYKYEIVGEDEEADICILGIQHINNKLLRKNEINIFLNLENFGVGRTHYQFYNKYGDDGNPLVDIYIQNHYTEVIYKNNIPKIIPVVDYRIKYFKKVYNQWSKDFNVPFEKKKFCLFVSANSLNSNKQKVCNLLAKIGTIEYITQYKNYLGDKENVHGYHMMKFFNQYKFIICFENSKTNGYITEKIFNVFHARSIPIYDGAPDIDNYINKNAYIKFDDLTFNKVRLLNSSKQLYEGIMNKYKINKNHKIREMNYLKYYVDLQT